MSSTYLCMRVIFALSGAYIVIAFTILVLSVYFVAMGHSPSHKQMYVLYQH